MNCKIHLTLALLATLGCQTAQKLIAIPRNTDIKVNQSTYFNCSTDFGPTAVFWFHGTKYVFTGNAILEPYHGRFTIDRTVWNGTYVYNLIVHSVQPGDAGMYTCWEDEGVGNKHSAQLIVLDADPTCRSNKALDEVIGQNSCNVDPDIVELECSVEYHGNIPPKLDWKKVGANSSTPLQVSVVASRNHFVSTLKVNGDIALNNSSYVCEARRTTHAPYKCLSEVINILYALSENSTINKTINDDILCKANTSQFCSYRWKWFQEIDITTESSTSVLMARKPGWHRCEAECYLRNNTCNLLVMWALVHGDPESSSVNTKIISTSVAVVVAVSVLGALAFVYIRRRVENSNATKEGGPLLREELQAIYGIAVLGQEVFISSERCVNIEVLDSITFCFKRSITVDGMIHAEPIVSCSVNKCLYTFVWEFMEQCNAMFRIDPSNGQLTKSWPVFGRGGRLSVANDANVILNINCKAKLHEYTAEGDLIRVIDLASGTDILITWHAVKLPSGLFVICQGCSDQDPINRVCLLSTKATTNSMGRIDEVEILKEFGRGEKESISLNFPMFLSANNEGSILVSDTNLVLLSSNLDNPRILVLRENRPPGLWRTCFDEPSGQWFVTNGDRIMVCRVQDKEIMKKMYDRLLREWALIAM